MLGMENAALTRVTQRNGYSRAWDTRVGTIIPKLSEGSYFPSLLEPRRRSERAPGCDPAGLSGRLSTRRVGWSKRWGARVSKELGVPYPPSWTVEDFLGWPLDGGLRRETEAAGSPPIPRDPVSHARPVLKAGDGGGRLAAHTSLHSRSNSSSTCCPSLGIHTVYSLSALCRSIASLSCAPVNV